MYKNSIANLKIWSFRYECMACKFPTTQISFDQNFGTSQYNKNQVNHKFLFCKIIMPKSYQKISQKIIIVH